MAFDDTGVGASSIEKEEDLGRSPESIVRRWKLELKLASKREYNWRKKAADIYKLYTPETSATSSFNILWTNTETLRQSVYNSLPQPQVKRRYSDEDELGRHVSEVLTRALEFAQDTYDFDAVLKGDVLSMLLPGRAVSRVRYVPDIRQIGGEESAADDDAQESESYEEVAWEQVVCERVQWDDFRILCAAKTWEEVSVIGFRHRLTREDCVDKFGKEIGDKIPLDAVDDEDVKNSKEGNDLFKTAEVWEIWDKEEKEVIFMAPGYPLPCKIQDDPLGLQGFFPIPKPLYAIENDQTLVPASLYGQYEQQAKELNKISSRINKLVEVMKVRGIYDSTLSELSELMKGNEADLIPAQNVTALLERGGLEKAIWMMPIDTIALVLKELNMQRDSCKQIIYEITGIADIMRSASDPNETFGAQKIKTQWGTQRLQRMQREVQRYIRDIIRLKAELIAEKFSVDTLEAMTLVKLPHDAQLEQQKKQMFQQWQQTVQQAHMHGQQPPPPPQLPPKPISWEDVMKAMHEDATRTYRIDIETDSTLSATQDSDVEGITKLLAGITQFIDGVGPAVQSGAMPIEAVKALVMAVVRRAKMGSVVEDELDKMQPPKPAPDPNAAKAQADMQMHQQKLQADQQAQQAQMQHEAQLEQMKAQLSDQQAQRELQYQAQKDQAQSQADMQMEQWKQQQQAAQIQHQNDLEAQRELQRQQLDAAVEQRKHEQNAALAAQQIEFDKWKTEFDNSTKIVIAQIAAQTAANAQTQEAERAAAETASKDLGGQKVDQVAKMHSEAMGKIADAMTQIAKPKTVVRDDAGKITGTK